MVLPQIVAGANRVVPGQLRVGRLERVDRMRRVARQVVADVADRGERDAGEILRAAEQRRHRG